LGGSPRHYAWWRKTVLPTVEFHLYDVLEKTELETEGRFIDITGWDLCCDNQNVSRQG